MTHLFRHMISFYWGTYIHTYKIYVCIFYTALCWQLQLVFLVRLFSTSIPTLLGSHSVPLPFDAVHHHHAKSGPLMASMCGAPTYIQPQIYTYVCILRIYVCGAVALVSQFQETLIEGDLFRSAVANVKWAALNQKSKINNIFRLQAPQINNK